MSQPSESASPEHPSPESPAPEQTAPATRRTAVLVGLVVVVMMAALAVVAVLMSQADEERLVADVPPAAEPGPDQPGTSEPTEPDTTAPLGSDSPLVGLSESEVRELYPLVRVVEVDGEPLMTTMDLQLGRINLALDGDTVVGATVEGCDDLGDDTPGWVQQACDPDPGTDGPSTFGKLLADPAGGDELTLEVGTKGDQYFQGMVVSPAADSTRISLLDGDTISDTDLLPDDVVYVWTAEGCRESSPVQCDIEAIVVDRGTS